MFFRIKKILFAFLLALLAMALSYVSTNLEVTISGERDVLKCWNFILNRLSGKPQNLVPDDVVFINVAADKRLVETFDGNAAITDRSKLTELLNLIQAAGNYSYVMLDVFFEEGYESEADSMLFSTICSMKNIVIPRHKDGTLISSWLEEKAAYSDYSTNLKEDNFAKYPLLHRGDNMPSMPLKIYSDLTGRSVKRHGLIFTDNKALSRRVIFPKMYVRDAGFFNMGSELLDFRETIDWKELLDNKIVIIGAFHDDDIHETYAGLIPGCVVNYNVLASLMRGQHRIPFGLTAVYFIIFFMMSLLLLSGGSDKKQQSLAWLWAKLFALYSVILIVVCVLVFTVWGQAQDIFITSTLFSIVDTGNRWISNRKKKNA